MTDNNNDPIYARLTTENDSYGALVYIDPTFGSITAMDHVSEGEYGRLLPTERTDVWTAYGTTHKLPEGFEEMTKEDLEAWIANQDYFEAEELDIRAVSREWAKKFAQRQFQEDYVAGMKVFWMAKRGPGLFF